MPSGDAQRAWFPEMLAELKRYWVDSPDWSDVIAFCEQMTSLRSEIRSQKGIRSPMMKCRSCGKKHAMTLPPISPRSLLFALQKINAVDDEQLKRLDKEWMRYRKSHDLDVRGHPKPASAADQLPTSACH